MDERKVIRFKKGDTYMNGEGNKYVVGAVDSDSSSTKLPWVTFNDDDVRYLVTEFSTNGGTRVECATITSSDGYRGAVRFRADHGEVAPMFSNLPSWQLYRNKFKSCSTKEAIRDVKLAIPHYCEKCKQHVVFVEEWGGLLFVDCPSDGCNEAYRITTFDTHSMNSGYDISYGEHIREQTKEIMEFREKRRQKQVKQDKGASKKRSGPTPNAESQRTKKQKVDEDGSAKEPNAESQFTKKQKDDEDGSAKEPNAESQCTKKQKVDEDGSAKEPLTGVALWKKKVKDVMCDSYGNEAHLVEVMEVLNKAKEANFPIDVEGFLGTWEGNNMNVLNSILYDSYYNGNDEQDINDLKKLLSMSKNWKRYWDREDKVFNSPLSWIEEKDEEAAIKLLPFFKKHGHIIDIRERNILGKNVLAEWDKLNNTDPE